MVDGQVQTAQAITTLPIGGQSFVCPRFRIKNAIPIVRVACRNIRHHSSRVRHQHVHCHHAVAAVHIGERAPLIALPFEGEAAHCHGKALGTNDGIHPQRVRTVDRQVGGNDAIATEPIGQLLHVIPCLRVGFAVPHKTVADGGVEQGGVRGADGQMEGHRAVAA